MIESSACHFSPTGRALLDAEGRCTCEPATAPATDLEKWTAFLDGQGIGFEVEEWDLRTKKQLVIRIEDERAQGFSGYGVGVAFSLDGAFLEMGGWA